MQARGEERDASEISLSLSLSLSIHLASLGGKKGARVLAVREARGIAFAATIPASSQLPKIHPTGGGSSLDLYN